MAAINNLVFSNEVGLVIFNIAFILLSINYKLFTIVRKSRRNNEISPPPPTKKLFSLKNISGCLLAFACLLVLSFLILVYIVLRLTSKGKEFNLDNAEHAGLWARTTASMNLKFNCLMFYWKNKILQAEGMRVIICIKICRRGQC